VDGITQIDPAPVLRAICADLRAGVSAAVISGWFHAAVTDLIAILARRARDAHGLETVALSGGVFQNVRLLASANDTLQGEGFTVLAHTRVPANDGGLALGQAVVGARVFEDAL
jgi:hydrogenase maturation protein HypF